MYTLADFPPPRPNLTILGEQGVNTSWAFIVAGFKAVDAPRWTLRWRTCSMRVLLLRCASAYLRSPCGQIPGTCKDFSGRPGQSSLQGSLAALPSGRAYAARRCRFPAIDSSGLWTVRGAGGILG